MCKVSQIYFKQRSFSVLVPHPNCHSAVT